MTKIAFICDAACDINEEFVKKNNIHVIPFAINFSEKSYLDGVDITRDEIYTKMKDEIPTTGVCAADIILKTLKEIEDSGVKNVIMASISSKLSGMHNLFRMCADNFKNLNIELIDTESISVGAGFPIIKGINAYNDGADFNTVVKTIKNSFKEVYVYAYFRDLTNLIKGGRIPKGKAYVANALNIKPIMTVEEGVLVEAKKVRGNKNALKFFKEKFKEHNKGKFYFSSIYANNIEDAKMVEDEFCEELKNSIYNVRTTLTPTVGVHAGTEFLAFVFMNE